MARTKQTTRKSTGGRGALPRRPIAGESHNFKIDFRKVKDDGERKKFVSRSISDLVIKMSNKNVKVWKSLFCKISNIPEDCDGEFNGLLTSSFRVEEPVILEFIMEKTRKRVYVHHDSLHHYYLFFKALGMKNQMGIVCEILERSDVDFKVLFNLFRTLTEEFDENPKIKDLFKTDKPVTLKVNDFKHAITMLLFKRLHDKYIEEQVFHSNPELFSIKDVQNVLMHIVQYEKNVESDRNNTLIRSQHGDFSSPQNPIANNSDLLACLRRGELSNMSLRTTDGGSFDVHREIIVYRSNFFHQMFEHNGEEMQQLRMKNFILIQNDIIRNRKIMSSILDYLYRDNVVTNDWKILIPLLLFSDMFREQHLKKLVLDKMYSISIRREQLVDVMDSVGDIFKLGGEFNEELLKLVAPRFKFLAKVSKEELKLMIDKSFQVNQLLGRVEGVERENSSLKEKMEDMNIEIGQLKDDVSKLKQFVARKRKRNNDDREARDERKQKRRKKTSSQGEGEIIVVDDDDEVGNDWKVKSEK